MGRGYLLVSNRYIRRWLCRRLLRAGAEVRAAEARANLMKIARFPIKLDISVDGDISNHAGAYFLRASDCRSDGRKVLERLR